MWERERELNTFFSWAPTLICSHHLFLTHILSPSLHRQILNCQGTCELLFQSGRQLIDPWTKECTVRSRVLWSYAVQMFQKTEGLLTSSSGQSSLLRPQGMCLSVSVALLAKQQLSTQIYVNLINSNIVLLLNMHELIIMI